MHMKFIFAPDSYKGTLSSHELIRLLKESASQVFPGCKTVGVPIADGGEGTLEAVIPAVGGEYRQVAVRDPLGGGITAKYGVFRGKALIEMACASGLTLVPAERRSPLRASSYGTGQLILDALEQGCRDIYVAVGGSATNDGGTGAMKALGVCFLDERGHELDGTGADLIRIQKIDRSRLSPLVRGAKFHVMCATLRTPSSARRALLMSTDRRKEPGNGNLSFWKAAWRITRKSRSATSGPRSGPPRGREPPEG